MKRAFVGLILSLALGIALSSRPVAAPSDLPTVDAAARLKEAKPDLPQRLKRFKPVRMPYDSSSLSANEKKMVDELIAASRALEGAFWRQSDPVGLALFKALASDSTQAGKDLRHYLWIN